jgi:site-specific recombinase XerD
MRSNQSFAVNFVKRRCKENKKRANIYARIYVDGGLPKEISLKEEIEASAWDEKREIVKGKGVETKAFNDYIDDVRSKIKEKYRELEIAGMLITAESVKQAYLGVQPSLKGHKLSELLDYYYKIWEPKLKDGGFKNYKTTIEYLRRFLAGECPGKDLYLSQLSMEVATNFEHYVRNNPIKAHDPAKGNGLGKNVQRFKRIVNWAVELKWIPANPFEKYSCNLKKAKRKKLTIQQLLSIERQEFADPTINYVKELFLHSCYTGFAFVDAMALTEEHFEWHADGSVWCHIYRQKSDELTAIPILRYAAKLLNKYRNRADYIPGKLIFPRITNQEVNKCLKIIQAVCGIQFSLTFHIARHTFATTVALKNGIPIEVVQVFLGHKKIASTKIYAEVDEEKIIEDTEGWEGKIERKREMALAARQLVVRQDSIQHWAN